MREDGLQMGVQSPTAQWAAELYRLSRVRRDRGGVGHALHPSTGALRLEDGPINQEITPMMLEQVGLPPFATSKGRQALRRPETANATWMPMTAHRLNVDGFEAARAIRRRPAHRHSPIVALTAIAFETARQACVAGLHSVMPQPALPGRLHRILLHRRPRPRVH